MRIGLVVVAVGVIAFVTLSIPLRTARDERPAVDRIFLTIDDEGRLSASMGTTSGPRAAIDLDPTLLEGPDHRRTMKALRDALVDIVHTFPRRPDGTSTLTLELRAPNGVSALWAGRAVFAASYSNVQIIEVELGPLAAPIDATLQAPRGGSVGSQFRATIDIALDHDDRGRRVRVRPARLFGARLATVRPTDFRIEREQPERLQSLVRLHEHLVSERERDTRFSYSASVRIDPEWSYGEWRELIAICHDAGIPEVFSFPMHDRENSR